MQTEIICGDQHSTRRTLSRSSTLGCLSSPASQLSSRPCSPRGTGTQPRGRSPPGSRGMISIYCTDECASTAFQYSKKSPPHVVSRQSFDLCAELPKRGREIPVDRVLNGRLGLQSKVPLEAQKDKYTFQEAANASHAPNTPYACRALTLRLVPRRLAPASGTQFPRHARASVPRSTRNTSIFSNNRRLIAKLAPNGGGSVLSSGRVSAP